MNDFKLSLFEPPRRVTEHDFYPTPAWVTAALLQHFPPNIHKSILDPAAGDGAILKECARAGWGREKLLACEIREEERQRLCEVASVILIGDYLRSSITSHTFEEDQIIANPPFRLMDEFIIKIAESEAEYKAVLARVSILSGNGQAHLRAIEKFEPTGFLFLARRPSFTDDGKTDNNGVAWMVHDDSESSHHALIKYHY